MKINFDKINSVIIWSNRVSEVKPPIEISLFGGKQLKLFVASVSKDFEPRFIYQSTQVEMRAIQHRFSI